MRRRIHEGDTYTIDEENDIRLVEVKRARQIATEIQGESWGWTKGPPYPLDYDGRRPE